MKQHASYYRHLASTLVLVFSLILSACGGGISADGSGSGGGEVVATLTWQKPTENTDNTSLEDLAGYKLYIGDSPTNLQPVIDIPASTTRFDITEGDVISASEQFENTISGVEIYFALSAYNSLRLESDLSEVVSKTF